MLQNGSGSMILAVAGVALLVYFRRAVFRILSGIVGVIVVMVVLVIVANLGIFIDRHFGLTAAIVSTLIVLCGFVAMGRATNSNGNSPDNLNDNDWYHAEDQARRDREDELREDQRLQDVHADAMHRNPW